MVVGVLGALPGVLAPPAAASNDFVTLLADLPRDEIEALRAEAEEHPLPDDPRELLDRIFLLGPAYRFDVGLVAVETDRRWFRTVGPGGGAAPLLELRRWPGDTVLALYVVRGVADPDGYRPPVPDAELEVRQQWEGGRLWEGSLHTPSGARPVGWAEWVVPDAGHRLGALLVPGDAGLGAGATSELFTELQAVFDRIEVRPQAWATVEDGVTDAIVLPELGLAPGESDESADPWQTVVGFDFTLGLPPGMRSRRLHPSLPGPFEIPGGVLWLRGRFKASEGESVVVGDRDHAGYVAEIRPVDADWAAGKTPPRGAPGATVITGADYDLAVERTRASAARAERWSDPSLDGEWLVFRLVLPERGVEIGLPVLAGRQAEALFRIPLSWREADEPPAPPPIDPAVRFGIRFEKLTAADRAHNPWIEGYLLVPGLRLELPRGWWPAASLRTDDGFPVHLMVQDHGMVGELLRVVPEEWLATERWKAIKRPKRFGARGVYDRKDGARLYVAPEGHAFLLVPRANSPSPPEGWKRLLDSASLLRTEP